MFTLPSDRQNMRCEYTSKRCENPRAIKPNGERHRLCEHHRRIANENQRRWQHRKRKTQQPTRSLSPPMREGESRHRETSSTPCYPEPEPTPLRLPRLRHHEVLSRALSLPAVPQHPHHQPSPPLHWRSTSMRHISDFDEGTQYK